MQEATVAAHMPNTGPMTLELCGRVASMMDTVRAFHKKGNTWPQQYVAVGVVLEVIRKENKFDSLTAVLSR